MQHITRISFSDMTDQEIVEMILRGHDEAVLYLIRYRYIDDVRYYVWKYYGSLVYLDDIIACLYIQLCGKNGDWAPLRSFKWTSKFRTWFSSVVSHLCLDKRRELIDWGDHAASILVDGGDSPLPEPEQEAPNEELLMLLEAISRLENDVYRFIIVKELEGYNHKEIATMLAMKRELENKVTFYNGKKVVPNARYVDMNKARALEELKALIPQIKKEWYEENK